jgi:hypothetical protein
MVDCCVMTGMAEAGFAVVVARSLLVVNFLGFAGLAVCCRNAAIR